MKLSNAQREVLRHLTGRWGGVINVSTFYLVCATGKLRKGSTWVPRGRTGATVAALMRMGLVDFEPKPGRIKKLLLTPSGKAALKEEE